MQELGSTSGNNRAFQSFGKINYESESLGEEAKRFGASKGEGAPTQAYPMNHQHIIHRRSKSKKVRNPNKDAVDLFGT